MRTRSGEAPNGVRPRLAGLGSLSGLIDGFTVEDIAPFISSMGLIAGRVVSMGLGFLAWLAAARLFAPADVGLASGVVAAMMLCVQLALVGIGSAVIALLPAHRDDAARLLDPAFTSVTLVALLAAGAFLLIARSVFHELDLVAADPALALAFVGMTLFGSLNVLYDNISIALRRGDQVLARNIAFGLVTIVVPLAVAPFASGAGKPIILGAWTLAGLAACGMGFVQTRRTVGGYRPRPRWDAPLLRRLVAVGLPNWALTMTERGPALLMPVLVTEAISPTTNAYWYAAWMMAWVVMIIPISAGQTLFAEAARAPERIAAIARHGLWTALGIGIPAAVGMALLAHVALSLLGPAYANGGDGALRILVISVIPFSIIQAYYAVCRARNRLFEATAAGLVGGIASVVAGILAGRAAGLTAMAIAWVSVQLLLGGWAALRLWTQASVRTPLAPAMEGARLHDEEPITGS
jgi:O-antigen/teichoic acid export membrane protein